MIIRLLHLRTMYKEKNYIACRNANHHLKRRHIISHFFFFPNKPNHNLTLLLYYSLPLAFLDGGIHLTLHLLPLYSDRVILARSLNPLVFGLGVLDLGGGGSVDEPEYETRTALSDGCTLVI